MRRAVSRYLKPKGTNTNPRKKDVPVSAFWSEAALMTTSGLMVAAVAVPVGLLARAARPRGEPLLPRWKPWRVPWNGGEVLFAFLVVSYVVPVFAFFLVPEKSNDSRTLRALWAAVLALPLQLGLLWVVARSLYPTWKREFIGRGSFAGKVSLAVLAWLALTPTVLVFNGAVNLLSEMLGVTPDKHPLTKLAESPALEQVLFVLRACVVAPIMEEVLFRGLLLSWCVGRIKVPGAGVAPVTGARPWFVMAFVIVLAIFIGEKRPEPVIFAVLLAVGLGVLWPFTRIGTRRARAVYATAALFAVVHSNVWPSPVALFAFGLGLGWLAVRTNGILVPVIVHSLFNAVSAVAVLRS